MPRNEQVTDMTNKAPANTPYHVHTTCGGDSGNTGYNRMLPKQDATTPIAMKPMKVTGVMPMAATRGSLANTAKDPLHTSATIVHNMPARTDTMVAEAATRVAALRARHTEGRFKVLCIFLNNLHIFVPGAMSLAKLGQAHVTSCCAVTTQRAHSVHVPICGRQEGYSTRARCSQQ